MVKISEVCESETSANKTDNKMKSNKPIGEKLADEKLVDEKQGSKKRSREKQAYEKQSSEKQTGEKQTSEKQAREKQAREKQTREKQAREKQTREKQTPEKQINENQKRGKHANENKDLLFYYLIAAAFRIALFVSPSFLNDIMNRVEVSTPINSLYRVTESLYRQKLGVDPYSSDILHESPLHLYCYGKAIDFLGEYLPLLFIACDLITAHCFYLVAKKYMFEFYVEQMKNKHTYCKDVYGLIMYGRDFMKPAVFAMCVYLFNPYTIFSCVAQTTTTINNVFLGLFFVGISYNFPVLSILSLTVSTTHSFYPIVLLSPMFLAVKKSHSIPIASLAVTIFFACLSFVFIVCRELYGSWDFIQYTYGFILSVKDQQPNVGVFWYFFMEMFEHFRLLFIYSYQINVTLLYFVPLSIKFRKDPVLLGACFCMLIAIFKSYPGVGDFAFTMALFPIWSYLYHCMQQIFISAVCILVTTALGPTLWDLWICWGTANANFYFGATLAFITAHIFLLTDISFGVSKYEYLLRNGNERSINNQPAKLVLE